MAIIYAWPVIFGLRLVLCIMLVVSRNCYYLVEQPSQSLLHMHKRWQYFGNRVSWDPWTLGLGLSVTLTEVCQVHFWMALHGSATPKRTVMMGNMRSITALDKGKLPASARAKAKAKTTRITVARSRLIK